MINDTNFLLGLSFSLLTQVRDYMIRKQEVEGVELIEEQYQKLNKALEDKYYTGIKE